MIEVNPYSSVIWAIAILIFSLDLVIILGSKLPSSRLFAILSFITGIWVTSQGVFVSISEPTIANLLIRFQYFLGIVISIGFISFSKIYPDEKMVSMRTVVLSFAAIILFFILFFYSSLFIINVRYLGGIARWSWSFGNLHLFFDLSFCLLWIISLRNLYLKFTRSTGDLRLNLKNMFAALFLGIIPPTIFNIVLPLLGNFSLNWMGPITSAIWVFILAYSIVRYGQLSVRIFFTEVLSIAITGVFFVNIFIDISFGVLGKIAIFIIFLIADYFLLKGLLRESAQREQLSELNTLLEDKVAAQTIELRKLYESEKRARIELEKLNDAKDQFIMITQHHLRTPLTTMLWSLESALKGDYGRVGQKVVPVLEDAQTAGKRLMQIVDDFLNITAMKIGTNILTLSATSLKPAITDVLEELKNQIAEMSISVSYPTDDQNWPVLNVDYQKIRESLYIILENAIKYNTHGGKVQIETETDGGNFKIKIINTGIGIDSEEKEKIGTSLFYRSMSARKNHPIGMGIGLSVVKAIIRAHHGIFDISSDGRDRGAEVEVVLPIDQVFE